MADTSEAPTAGDLIGAMIGLVVALGLISFPSTTTEHAKMLADFGRVDRMPLLTQLALGRALPIGLGVVVLAMIAYAARSRRRLVERRAILVGAFAVGGLGLAVLFVGAMLPIWQLAGAIRAD
jgi:uncharacterized BrkB/YihY/UPF0761 family membrane protein